MPDRPRRPFGQWAYDYAVDGWSWDAEMRAVTGLAPDGEDLEALLFGRMHPHDVPRIAEQVKGA